MMEAVETYEHLNDGSRQFNDGLENPSSPPKDVNNKLYLALIMAGIGFVSEIFVTKSVNKKLLISCKLGSSLQQFHYSIRLLE